MVRALVLMLVVLAAEEARSECFVLCDPEVRGAEAAERLALESPELNPVESVWQYLRETWISLQGWDDDPLVRGVCRKPWSRSLAQPQVVSSVTTLTWVRDHQ